MNKYDPTKHHRRSIRLPDWDYRSPGYYFVTICTYERTQLFTEPDFMTSPSLPWRVSRNKTMPGMWS